MRRYSIGDAIPHYQPIVELSTGKTAMYECLARFKGLGGDPILPADIGHLFEDPLFLWDLFENTFPKVLRHAMSGRVIAVNIDLCSMGERFFSYLEHVFHKHPTAARNILFEVTERDIGRDLSALADCVEKIKGFGCQVAMDDFGTGGANIECLQAVGFDHVKIDGQFFREAAVSESGFKKLELIVKLLRIHKGQIVGEHIENGEIDAIAKKLGVDYAQGYHYGKPSAELG